MIKLILLLKEGAFPDYVIFFDGSNEFYSALTSTKVALAINANAKKGKTHGITAYGYAKDENGFYKTSTSGKTRLFQFDELYDKMINSNPTSYLDIKKGKRSKVGKSCFCYKDITDKKSLCSILKIAIRQDIVEDNDVLEL